MVYGDLGRYPFFVNLCIRAVKYWFKLLQMKEKIYIYIYIKPVLRSKDYVRSRIKNGSVVCLYTPVSLKVSEIEGYKDAWIFIRQ